MSASRENASSRFDGDVLIVAPHMDDEALGCGMLIAERSARCDVRVLFATDGARSPEPLYRWPRAFAPRTGHSAREGLPEVRAAEAIEALAVLGVPRANVEFLGFPDGALDEYGDALADILTARVSAWRPSCLFVPFRYDRHKDHLAVNRAAQRCRDLGAMIVEYFVYTEWRLLRLRDMREYVSAAELVRVSSPDASARKRAALACYRSQTTRYFPWQRAPILSEALIDRVCDEAEAFFVPRSGAVGRNGLARGRYWVPIACRLEPALKRWKDAVKDAVAPRQPS